MDQIQSSYAAARQNPVKTGIFAVLGVVAIGAAAGFALGYDAPAKTWAIAPITVVAPVAPVVTVPIVTVPIVTAPVVTPIVSPVTVTAPPASENPAPAPSTETPTTVSGVTVTAPVSNNDSTTDPCCSNTTPTTPTNPIIPTNSTTNPCCTNTTPTTPIVIVPPVVVTPVVVTPIDACPNLDGLQASVPDGYEVNGNGNCEPPTIDFCPNIGGIQFWVPAGYIIDANGNCVPPPVDFCPNLPGFQGSLPAGYYVDGDGNCVTRTTEAVLECVFLTGTPAAITPGQAVTLAWQTRNANAISINNGVGPVYPVGNGSTTVYPTQTTTYVATVSGASGNVNCQTTVTVTPVEIPSAQCVFLTGTPAAITPGQTVTLAWQTRNATSISIDNGVGQVLPTAAGSVTVNPTQTTTYTATVTGATGSVNCQTTVTVSTVEQPPAQCVFLTGTPAVINAGDAVNLAWKTLNAGTVTIDNGVGQVSAEGSTTVRPTQNTTYRLSATGATGTVHCQTTVTLTTIEQGPMCVSLKADRTTIRSGEAVTLSWETNNASSISIDNGIGLVSPTAKGSYVVNPTSDTTYIATVPGAPANDNCKVRVTIESSSCTSNCGGGGGGGGGRRSPRVVLDSLTDFDEPLSFVYLSEVPYTGLELGTWGTVLYWMMLIGWSLALAYLVLFNAVPFALARAKTFGSNVKDAMNADAPSHGHDTHVAAVAHAVAHAPSGHGHADPHAAPAKPAGYSAHDGFRSFAAGEGLTIDDIVKGLSREIEQKHEAPAAPTHQEVMQAVYEAPTPAPEYVPTPAPAPAAPRYAPAAAPAMAPMNGDVRDFVAALLNGDRDTVFGMIRSMARQGHDTEAFVSNAACALDDAYRACIDGTTCHPDIAELTNGCHPSYLERLVASLTTAVDGSYSAGMTGVKMALTRALGVVAG